MSAKYQPTHRAPDSYTGTFHFGGEIVIKGRASNPKQAKAYLLELAREVAAQITATAVIDEATEAQVDDWCITIPNRNTIKIEKDEVKK